jgi:hypothetical protein
MAAMSQWPNQHDQDRVFRALPAMTWVGTWGATCVSPSPRQPLLRALRASSAARGESFEFRHISTIWIS